MRVESPDRGSANHDTGSSFSVLLAEHEPMVAEQLVAQAAARGIDTHWYRDGADALLAVGAEMPSLVVLAAHTRTVSTDDVVRSIRARSTVPILVGAAASDGHAGRRALAAGATAVVARPYDVATIAAFADSAPEGDSVLSAGPLRVDRRRHAAWIHDRELTLSHREFELLAYLVEQQGRLVSQEQISHAVWGQPSETNTVAVHIKRLRNKLGADPEHGQLIRTIRGLGYGLSLSVYSSAVAE